MRRYKLGLNNNMRDLGGLINKEGKILKYFKFIRSDLPQNINEKGINYLKNNGVTTVIDLRNENECNKKENCLKEHFTYYNINLNGSNYPNTSEDIPKGYMEILEDYNNIKKVFDIILESNGGIIYNCTAGKDRTGIISMLLLLLADSCEDDIIVDYEVSYTYIRDFVRKMHRDNVEMPAFVGRSDMEIMENTLILFKNKYKSIQNYFKLLGYSKKEINILMEKMIDE